MKYSREFQEIGQSGGLLRFMLTTTEGRRKYSLGYRHIAGTPLSVFSVYASPEGQVIGVSGITGEGGNSTRPEREAYQVFIGSDSHGMFGRKCLKCEGYWRSTSVPAYWRTTCPYCGFREASHKFLTEGHQRYISKYCEYLKDSIQNKPDGEHIIDLYEIAKTATKDSLRPDFYYVEESQQNKFKCTACNGFNDIIGKYGYCSNCGTHNGVEEFGEEILRIRDRIEKGQEFESCLKDAVSTFDGYMRHMSNQLVNILKISGQKHKEWERKIFHKLKVCAEDFKSAFDIDIFSKLDEEEIKFSVLMFLRRNVYEHKAGVVDEKYIIDSGDNSVRLNQVIRETQASVTRLINNLLLMAYSTHEGVHSKFPPEKSAL